LIWAARYHNYVNDTPSSLAVNPDGSRVFVTGTSPRYASPNDYATVAYDAATGEPVWIARYDGPASGYDAAHSIAVTPNGATVIVAGSSYGVGIETNSLTVGYNATTGRQIWSARGAAEGALAAAVAVSPFGTHVFIGGSALEVETDWDIITTAYAMVLSVEIDIKPSSALNRLNPCSRGVLPVAVLGSDEFDVTEIDVGSLRLGPGEARPAHEGHIEDVGLDGIPDLLVHFPMQDAGIAFGDESVSLAGSLKSGFPIDGSDSVMTVGCKGRPR
jgi:hypothetical protein